MLSFAFLSWTPSFMMRAMNIGEDKAGLLMAVIAVAALIGTLLGGWLSDMWYRKNVKSRLYIAALASLLCLVVYIPGILLLGAGQLVPALVFLAFFGIFIVIYYPSIQVATQEVVHPSMKGMSFGMYSVFIFLMSAPGPVLVGAISDAMGGGVVGLQNALIISSLLSLLSILFFWLASRSYVADVEKVKNIKLEAK
jgi:sugar phosphate permease